MKYLEYKENKKHGSQDFPIEYYFVDESHPQYNMALHWHREFEFIRVISGKLNLTVDSNDYELKAGDIALVGSCALHKGVPEGCKYECIVFDLSVLSRKFNVIEPYILPIIKHSVSVKCVLSDNADLKANVYKLFGTVKNQKSYYELEVLSLLYGIFFDLYSGGLVADSGDAVVGNSHQMRIMAELLDWIDRKYPEAIKLSELATKSGFSEKYLCTLFKKYTSKTPVEYINHIRIENACYDLLHTDLSITEVALKNGFNNLNYFTKIFKKNTGTTPRAYKKMRE